MAEVRRLVAMLLLAVFGLPLVSSSLALGQSSEASLPACCRRAGEHHCAMPMAERAASASQAPAWTSPLQRCPYCPASITAGHHVDAVWLRGGSAAHFGFRAVAGPVVQAQCAHRLARERSRHKRGPPLSPLV